MYFYPAPGFKISSDARSLLLLTSPENIRGWRADESVTDAVECDTLLLHAAEHLISFRSEEAFCFVFGQSQVHTVYESKPTRAHGKVLKILFLFVSLSFLSASPSAWDS